MTRQVPPETFEIAPITSEEDRDHVEACWNLIEEEGDATFTKLVDLLDKRGVRTSGPLALTHPRRPNCILWYGLSERAATILAALCVEPSLRLDETSPLTYLVDGGPVPKMEIGTIVRGGDYWTPKWIPTVVTSRYGH
jgi:hypothetical protein